MAKVYHARWCIRASGEVVPEAGVVASAGRIVRVGPWKRLAAHVGPDERVEHFPDGAILPGFVNAHTHLALSDMRGKFRPTRNFAAWIGRLTARVWVRGKDAAQKAVRRGVEESLAAGTVAAADMAHGPPFDIPPDEARGRWIIFRELFRFGAAGLAGVEQAVAALQERPPAETIRLGLAPHAPYTASAEVYAAARRAADARGWPVSTHLHETLDEIAFVERGEGALHDWMRRLRILPRDWRPTGLRPIRMLAEAGFFAGPVLAAHGNYLNDEDIAILARSGSSVAFCPRSHAFFKHQGHPWRRLLAAGVNVCLGTDSLASSPSLSVLEEARHVFARESGADPRTLLEMATRRGARALGLENVVGDLREGLAAEFAVVQPVAETREVLAAILAGEGNVARLAAE
jgi:cytosine/adenosine deaminase-related metal-dependent hydrolase